MTTYYIPTTITTINANTWREVKSASSLDREARDTHDREAVFAPYTILDAHQMYDIADACPSWDCLDPEYYDSMAELVGVDPAEFSDAGSVEPMMDAIASALKYGYIATYPIPDGVEERLGIAEQKMGIIDGIYLPIGNKNLAQKAMADVRKIMDSLSASVDSMTKEQLDAYRGIMDDMHSLETAEKE